MMKGEAWKYGAVLVFSWLACAIQQSAALIGMPRTGKLEDYGTFLTTEPRRMTQRVDHFDPLDKRTFQQRYYEFTDYFRAPSGPIFLKICGESTCYGISNDYNGELAKQFGAALVTLEHRYYGESSPFSDYQTENLRYLSSKQALFDLAAFRDYYQEEVRMRYNMSESDNQWIVFGISYSGALSAWFRTKFPHLVQGSIASSGVVLAVFDYTDFDKQVAISAGPTCASALREVTAKVDIALEKNATAIKSLFGAEQLTKNGDFLYFLADAGAIAFQYGNPDILCAPLESAYLQGKDVVETYAQYVKSYYLGSFGSSVDTYDQEKLKNIKTGGDRLWWYQVCTEVAYFQVAYNTSVRSAGVSLKYHLDLCSNVFGNNTYPEVDITNLYYGGTGIAGSKIFFLNGSQDPWRHASKQTSSPDLPAYIITCHNCGHGTDMRGCPQSPLQLKGDLSKCTNQAGVLQARVLIVDHIKDWLGILGERSI